MPTLPPGRSEFYRSKNGCLGILYNCRERFDLPLFLAPPVAAAANEAVASLRPFLEAVLGGSGAELVELSIITTCQRWVHACTRA